MYTPGYGARDSPSARTVVGRDHAYDMGPVVTYDMVADDCTRHFAKEDLKRLSYSGRNEEAVPWAFVLNTTVGHTLGKHAQNLLDWQTGAEWHYSEQDWEWLEEEERMLVAKLDQAMSPSCSNS